MIYKPDLTNGPKCANTIIEIDGICFNDPDPVILETYYQTITALKNECYSEELWTKEESKCS